MALDIVPEDPTFERSALRRALKRSASALKRDGVPFALAGGYALWAEGDVEAAAESLRAEGFTVERPPEDWLFKALTEDAMVDVLHRLRGVPVTPELLGTAVEQELLGLRMPVLPPTPIMVAKLRSLSEHYCDFTNLLPAVRALREQLDWTELQAAGTDHPYAEAFLLLADRLGIAPPTSG
jgi:hypothetical protein